MTNTPNKEVPACIHARKKFIYYFLGMCTLLSLFGFSEAATRYYGESIIWVGAMGGYTTLLTVLFGLLLIPARTKRGSLLQLLGLVFPFVFTLAACYFCWGTPSHDSRLAYLMMIGWICIIGVLYVYLPCYIIHKIWCYFDAKSEKE